MGKTLITRPIAQAQKLSEELNAYGIDTLIHPMLDIEFINIPRIDFQKYEACIITSLNAAKILIDQCDDKDFSIYCVGFKTAQYLKESGFLSIKNISHSVQDLIITIGSNINHNSMLYLRGDKVTSDLRHLLPKHNIEEYIVYKSHKIKKLDKDLIQALQSDEVSNIIFYSARTIDAFIKAIITDDKQSIIQNALTRTRALCLTDKMVEYASRLPQENGIDIRFKAILSLDPSKRYSKKDALISILKELDEEK